MTAAPRPGRDAGARRGTLALASLLAALAVGGAACVEADVEADGALATPRLAVARPPGGVPAALIPPRSEWGYHDGEPLAGTAWRIGGGCDLDCFARGVAPLGYGEPHLTTTIGYGADPGRKHVTVYTRARFAPRHPTHALFLRLMYDDGAVVYHNGLEIARLGMPPGPITSSTLALGHDAGARYITVDLSAALPLVSRRDWNWLAFEIHQASPSSTDLVFDAELVAWLGDPLDATTDVTE